MPALNLPGSIIYARPAGISSTPFRLQKWLFDHISPSRPLNQEFARRAFLLFSPTEPDDDPNEKLCCAHSVAWSNSRRP
jgi:hypothetical protein